MLFLQKINLCAQMKIDPIEFLIKENIDDKKFYIISGNEITLMKKICDLILKRIGSNKNFNVEKLKNYKQIKNEVGLFEEKVVYVFSEFSDIKEEVVNEMSKKNYICIFIIENSTKIKGIKNTFIKRKDSYVLDCYELIKGAKTKIINFWLNKNNLSIEKDAYWSLVDNIDDKYGLLEKELDKLLGISKNNININDINKILSKNTNGSEIIFFKFNQNYKYLVDIYNEKITNEKEVNQLFYFIKQMSYLFLNNLNEKDFINNIPKYMFREKDYLFELFKKISNKKKKLIISLLYETEKNLRNDSALSIELGLRFLLRFRKLIIS